jgi:uncharacterized protein YndB with AHSA1/START domain
MTHDDEAVEHGATAEGNVPMSKFVYVTYIRTSAAKLWDMLTKPQFTRAYWCETVQESDWRVGAEWRMLIPDGRVGDAGTVLEIDPPRRLVLSSRNEFLPELKAEGHARVSFEIEPVGDVVRLTLTHEIGCEPSKLIDGVSAGWPAVLSSLKSLVETGAPLDLTQRWPKDF